MSLAQLQPQFVAEGTNPGKGFVTHLQIHMNISKTYIVKVLDMLRS